MCLSAGDSAKVYLIKYLPPPSYVVIDIAKHYRTGKDTHKKNRRLGSIRAAANGNRAAITVESRFSNTATYDQAWRCERKKIRRFTASRHNTCLTAQRDLGPTIFATSRRKARTVSFSSTEVAGRTTSTGLWKVDWPYTVIYCLLIKCR